MEAWKSCRSGLTDVPDDGVLDHHETEWHSNWKPLPQRTRHGSFPGLPNTGTSHKMESYFIFLKYFKYYQKVIMSRSILKLVKWRRSLLFWTAYAKEKKCCGTEKSPSPLCDSGETGAGICIQFGDLIIRKRETYCRKIRRNQQE